jgi:hypothetical protein
MFIQESDFHHQVPTKHRISGGKPGWWSFRAVSGRSDRSDDSMLSGESAMLADRAPESLGVIRRARHGVVIVDIDVNGRHRVFPRKVLRATRFHAPPPETDGDSPQEPGGGDARLAGTTPGLCQARQRRQLGDEEGTTL